MTPIDRDFLSAVAPHFSGVRAQAQAAILDAIGGEITGVFEAYEIDTDLRIIHCIAQLCHESAGFQTTEEFASGRAYEGRRDLGNTQPGDGVRYKGRGLIQLTGRANYREIGAKLGLDLEGDPELAAEPVVSLKIACAYWNSRNISPMADRDDILAVTKAINGGLNGLDDRRKRLRRAREEMAKRHGIVIAHAQAGTEPVLRRGSEGTAVAELQALLRAKGFPLAIDGDFGPATETAVKLLQASAGLKPDGIVGARTRAALA